MWFIMLCGLIFLAIIAIKMPRTILGITGGIIFGGAWWCLFIPLALIGLAIDSIYYDDIQVF